MCDTYMKPKARIWNVFYILRNTFVSFFHIKKAIIFPDLKATISRVIQIQAPEKAPRGPGH